MSGNALTQVLRDGAVTVIEFGPKCKLLEEAMLDTISQEVLPAAQAATPPLVVIDLTQTEFFGSGFIEVLFRVWNRIQQKQGGKMSLCGLQPYCREVIEVTHLDKLWPLHATRSEAVADLAAP
jgi:anti-anti-sigma factor